MLTNFCTKLEGLCPIYLKSVCVWEGGCFPLLLPLCIVNVSAYIYLVDVILHCKK